MNHAKTKVNKRRTVWKSPLLYRIVFVSYRCLLQPVRRIARRATLKGKINVTRNSASLATRSTSEVTSATVIRFHIELDSESIHQQSVEVAFPFVYYTPRLLLGKLINCADIISILNVVTCSTDMWLLRAIKLYVVILLNKIISDLEWHLKL